jgi:Rieske Fe-S protein
MFCKAGLVGVGGIIGLSVIGGGGVFLGSPALTNRTEGQWIEVGGVDDFSEEGYERVVLEFPIQDGWAYASTKMLAYVRRDGDNVVALSAVCTHLGCNVRFDEERNEFICPCHAGVYDFNGKNIAGPPPHPLAPLPVKVEDGVVLVYNKQEGESDGEEAA